MDTNNTQLGRDSVIEDSHPGKKGYVGAEGVDQASYAMPRCRDAVVARAVFFKQKKGGGGELRIVVVRSIVLLT